MNWYQSIIWEIKYYARENWMGYLIGLVLSASVVVVVYGMAKVPKDVLFPPSIDRITNLAEGKLINIRATGSFTYTDTELKFEDGSMILVTYGFSRRNNLKEGGQYKIWYSSIYGKRCKELK